MGDLRLKHEARKYSRTLSSLLCPPGSFLRRPAFTKFSKRGKRSVSSETHHICPRHASVDQRAMYWEDDDVEALQRAAALEDREAAAAATRAANAKLRAPAEAVNAASSRTAPSKTALPAPAPARARVAELEARVVALVAERDVIVASLQAALDETKRLRDARVLEFANASAEFDETNARVKRSEADAADSTAVASRLRRELGVAAVSNRETIAMLEKEAIGAASVLAETARARDDAEAKAVAAETELVKRESEFVAELDEMKAAHADAMREATSALLEETDKARVEASTSVATAAEQSAKLKNTFAKLEQSERFAAEARSETRNFLEELRSANAARESLLLGVAGRDARLASMETELHTMVSRLKYALGVRDVALKELESAKAERLKEKPESVSVAAQTETPADAKSSTPSVAPKALATNMSRGLRVRDLNLSSNNQEKSPMVSPGKGKARRFAAVARKASVVAALGAGAWRAVKGDGGAPLAVPFGVM